MHTFKWLFSSHGQYSGVQTQHNPMGGKHCDSTRFPSTNYIQFNQTVQEKQSSQMNPLYWGWSYGLFRNKYSAWKETQQNASCSRKKALQFDL